MSNFLWALVLALAVIIGNIMLLKHLSLKSSSSDTKHRQMPKEEKAMNSNKSKTHNLNGTEKQSESNSGSANKNCP